MRKGLSTPFDPSIGRGMELMASVSIRWSQRPDNRHRRVRVSGGLRGLSHRRPLGAPTRCHRDR